MHSSLFPWVLVGLLGVPSLALALPEQDEQDEEEPDANDACSRCHEDPTLKRADGRALRRFDETEYATSVHGQEALECVDCHEGLADVTEFPHQARLEPVDCAGCHARAARLYDKSAHARSRASGGGDAATCADCHGAHDVLPSREVRSHTNHFRLPRTCGRCHGDPALIARAGIRAGDTFHSFDDSIHGRALSRAGLVVAPNCADCHRAHDVLERVDPASSVFRGNVPGTCGRCHQGIEEQYRQGIHGTALAAGEARAPVCSDCHTAHNIRRAETSQWRLDVIAECGTCHEDYISSYRDTFHGQVTALGFTRIATCADCHGAHLIFPSQDERSAVSAVNRLETCRRCHPGVSANFALYDPHVDPDDRERNPLIYHAGRFMKWLLLGVFSFFGLHALLWLVREVVEVRRARRSARPA